MGLQRTLADASGRSVTEPKWFIRKRRIMSRSGASSCQGGCRGFDPRFPLQANSHAPNKLGAPLARATERSRAREFKKEFKDGR